MALRPPGGETGLRDRGKEWTGGLEVEVVSETDGAGGSVGPAAGGGTPPIWTAGAVCAHAQWEIRLYRAVREAVPVVDAAIYKLIRMVGGVTAACSDPAAERGLGEFLRTVPGRDGGQYGVNGFWEG